MRKPSKSVWIVPWSLVVILFLYPINTLPIRVGLVLSFFGGCAGAIWFFRRRKLIFYGLLGILLVTCAFLICPGRSFEPGKLREAYLRGLRSYEGTRYVWGGEGKFGIDCSGLVRAGLMKASFNAGVLTLNPELVRFSLSLWWHDCSAKSLGEEYRGLTKRIITAKGINALDAGHITPGDIAVTASGVHVLAYLGGNEWIEADPELRRVVIVEVPAVGNPWFQEPVRIMRWTELTD